MRAILILSALLLPACGPGDRRAALLEADYAGAITTADQCRVAGEIAALYLEQSNAEKYRLWKSLRDVHCVAVSIRGNSLVR